MKVIEDNRTIAKFKFPFRFTCQSCKSKLEVEESADLTVQVGEGQQGTYTYFTVHCPCCKYDGIVSPKDSEWSAADYYAK